MTWAQALNADQAPVDFFYCAKSREDAPHLGELEAIAKSKSNLNLHLFFSSEGNRLSADMVAEVSDCDLSTAKVFFCGPVSLRKALQAGLRRHGVGPHRFHYEEFEFRTGIGIKQLAAWVLERGKRQAIATTQR